MPQRGVDEWFWSVGDLQRLHEELLRSRPVVASGKAWEPRVDVLEDERRFIVKAELSGVRGEEIQLMFLPERHSLIIRGRRDDETPTERRLRVHQLEIPFGEFSREVQLPDVPVAHESMRAQYHNGFLLVTIPKAETVVVTKTFTITGL